MAHKYVDSNASGAADGSSWADAYTTLKAAAEAAGTSAGDSIWVAQDHAESTAGAVAITFKNTPATPGTCICVNKAGTVPPVSADLATTATVTTTGANALSLDGTVHIYGITFSGGSGVVTQGIALLGSSTGVQAVTLEACALVVPGTSAATGKIAIGRGNPTVPQRVIFRNTTVNFGATGDSMNIRCAFLWEKTPSAAIAGATLPDALLFHTADSGPTNVRGVDLSALGSGQSLVRAVSASTEIFISNCKLGASVAVSASQAGPGADVILVNCDSGDTNYRTEKHNYMGTQTVETTTVRSGGASDGTTPIAWKFVATANAERLIPFESLPITIWNETLTEQTLTVYGFQNDASIPTNADIWMEVEYLGTSGLPLSTFVSTGPADVLAAGANCTADAASTWGDGSDTTTRFKMQATFTAAEKGPITVRIYVAEASATFFIDPKVELS